MLVADLSGLHWHKLHGKGEGLVTIIILTFGKGTTKRGGGEVTITIPFKALSPASSGFSSALIICTASQNDEYTHLCPFEDIFIGSNDNTVGGWERKGKLPLERSTFLISKLKCPLSLSFRFSQMLLLCCIQLCKAQPNPLPQVQIGKRDGAPTVVDWGPRENRFIPNSLSHPYHTTLSGALDNCAMRGNRWCTLVTISLHWRGRS